VRPDYMTSVIFKWRAEGVDDTAQMVIRARQVLYTYHKRIVPRELRTPFLCVYLPQCIETKRCVVGMKKKKGQIRCRAIAAPRAFDGEVTTTLLTEDGETRTYIVCAYVNDAQALCHPGGHLLPKDLVTGEVSQHVDTDEHIMKLSKSEAFDSLIAVATWRAEMLRATEEQRDFDVVKAQDRLELSPWKVDGYYKKVFVLWSSRASDTETWEEHMTAATVNTLVKSLQK